MNGDSPCQRRDFLKMATVGTVGLAGCGASSKEPKFRITSLWFANHHDEAHTLKATITESGAVVFEERIKLGSADGADDPEYHHFPDHPTEPGAYVLDATLDDSESPLGGVQSWSMFAESTECAMLGPRVWQDGSAAIVYSTTCAPLSETRNADDA
jgi:hypothetical protein